MHTQHLRIVESLDPNFLNHQNESGLRVNSKIFLF